MNSIMQRAKDERRRLVLNAINGVVIPEYQYGKEHPIPAHVKEIINQLKIDGAFSFRTYERDIWRSLHKIHIETTKGLEE